MVSGTLRFPPAFGTHVNPGAGRRVSGFFFPYYLYIKLPYPLGIADLKSLPGAGFDAQAYGQVSQHLYMGYLDRNDTLPFDEA